MSCKSESELRTATRSRQLLGDGGAHTTINAPRCSASPGRRCEPRVRLRRLEAEAQCPVAEAAKDALPYIADTCSVYVFRISIGPRHPRECLLAHSRAPF